MKDNIFIKKCTEINDEEFKCVFNKINDTDKIKVLKDKRKIMGYYLLDKYLEKFNSKTINDIYYSENGKPLIDGIYFSIANKDDITVLAVSKHRIGVDIEKINEYDKTVLKYFFKNEEIKKIKTNEDFFKYYTLKEAYVKMMDDRLIKIHDANYLDYNYGTIVKGEYVISFVEDADGK